MSRPKIAGVVLLAAMLAVWAVRALVGDDGSAAPARPGPTAEQPATGQRTDTAGSGASGPRAAVAAADMAGVPVGYPRSDRGAVTAAVNWVASFPTIVRLGPIRLDDTMRQLLSAGRSASGTEEVVADYFTLLDQLGPDFAQRVWIESPLQTVVTAANDSVVEVSVWAVLVTGELASGPVEAVWRTHHISLVWERDDWRIDEVTISEGPTPVPAELSLPSPSTDFEAVDGWSPAVFADTTIGDE